MTERETLERIFYLVTHLSDAEVETLASEMKALVLQVLPDITRRD